MACSSIGGRDNNPLAHWLKHVMYRAICAQGKSREIFAAKRRGACYGYVCTGAIVVALHS